MVLEQDRKSTRLNSSHLVISYAVFCLKKKNRCGRPGPVALTRDSAGVDRAWPRSVAPSAPRVITSAASLHYLVFVTLSALGLRSSYELLLDPSISVVQVRAPCQGNLIGKKSPRLQASVLFAWRKLRWRAPQHQSLLPACAITNDLRERERISCQLRVRCPSSL